MTWAARSDSCTSVLLAVAALEFRRIQRGLLPTGLTCELRLWPLIPVMRVVDGALEYVSLLNGVLSSR